MSLSPSQRFRRLVAPAAALALTLSAIAVTPASARNPGANRVTETPVAAATVAPIARPAPRAVKPAAPAKPVAARKGSRAVVTWKAPADHGSAITGYVVTPYRNGRAQPAKTFDAASTRRYVKGLHAGGTYTFTVAARNAAGVGPACRVRSAAGCPAATPAPRRRAAQSSRAPRSPVAGMPSASAYRR